MDEKARLRALVLARRDKADNRLVHSSAIGRLVAGLPKYVRAGTVSWFVGVKSEVTTLPLIGDALATRRLVALPCVTPAGLRLVRIESLDELVPAPFGLLEPAPRFRQEPSRQVKPADVDFFAVPGVAFDKRGGRLGHGKAYYDGLLAQARPDACRAGLCFELQIVDQVPMEAHDIRMDYVVTEATVYGAERAARASTDADSRSQ